MISKKGLKVKKRFKPFIYWCLGRESNSHSAKRRGILSPSKPFSISHSTSCKTCQISIITGIDESWHVGWSQVESGQNSTPRAQFRHKKGVVSYTVLPLVASCLLTITAQFKGSHTVAKKVFSLFARKKQSPR